MRRKCGLCASGRAAFLSVRPRLRLIAVEHTISTCAQNTDGPDGASLRPGPLTHHRRTQLEILARSLSISRPCRPRPDARTLHPLFDDLKEAGSNDRHRGFSHHCRPDVLGRGLLPRPHRGPSVVTIFALLMTAFHVIVTSVLIAGLIAAGFIRSPHA